MEHFIFAYNKSIVHISYSQDWTEGWLYTESKKTAGRTEDSMSLRCSSQMAKLDKGWQQHGENALQSQLSALMLFDVDLTLALQTIVIAAVQ